MINLIIASIQRVTLNAAIQMGHHSVVYDYIHIHYFMFDVICWEVFMRSEDTFSVWTFQPSSTSLLLQASGTWPIYADDVILIGTHPCQWLFRTWSHKHWFHHGFRRDRKRILRHWWALWVPRQLRCLGKLHECLFYWYYNLVRYSIFMNLLNFQVSLHGWAAVIMVKLYIILAFFDERRLLAT